MQEAKSTMACFRMILYHYFEQISTQQGFKVYYNINRLLIVDASTNTKHLVERFYLVVMATNVIVDREENY